MEKMLLAGAVAGVIVMGGAAVVGGICKIAYTIHQQDRALIDVQRATIEFQDKVIKSLFEEDKKTEA